MSHCTWYIQIASGFASARAGNRRVRWLSTLRAHTTAPYKLDLLWETLRALNRPRQARAVRLQLEERVAREEIGDGGEVGLQ